MGQGRKTAKIVWQGIGAGGPVLWDFTYLCWNLTKFRTRVGSSSRCPIRVSADGGACRVLNPRSVTEDHAEPQIRAQMLKLEDSTLTSHEEWKVEYGLDIPLGFLVAETEKRPTSDNL